MVKVEELDMIHMIEHVADDLCRILIHPRYMELIASGSD